MPCVKPDFFYKVLLHSAALWGGAIYAHAAPPQPSTSLYGPLGLLAIPSARMDHAGTLRAGVSTLDPYVHSWLSVQLADPLSITLRQSAEISNINEDAKRLYPGVDFKLRLLEESAYRPEIAIGARSAFGHKRMAGEYISASKRYKDFDFTAGLGWGRLGSAAHFKNPLKSLSSHFGGNRNLDGEMPSGPENWFTGGDIGLFGGVEYFTPLKGLSLKADYGADRFKAEQAAFDYNAPAPWAVGLNYQPAPWIDLSLGMQGTDKLMARLSLQGNVKKWPDQDRKYTANDESPFRPYRTGLALPAEMELKAAGENIMLYDAQTDYETASATLTLENNRSSPCQLARAFKHMANHAGPSIERLEITPIHLGLRGPKIALLRADLENALGRQAGSAEEIWHNMEIIPSAENPLRKHHQPLEYGYGLRDYALTLDTQASLSEEDSGTLYRTALVAGAQAPELFGLIDNFVSFRLNLADNLDRLTDIRPRAALPVRSDVDRFARRTIALDTAFNAFTHSFRSDLHTSLMGGYLEEMYAGAGGEILYRPYKARWAVGAESFLVLKRNPESTLNLGLNGDHLLSGHIQGWYDLPHWDITVNAKAGRYLAEDLGATLSLQKRFHGGAVLEAYSTITNQSDFDLFGGTTHADHGIRLALPLGGIKYIPRNAKAKFTLAPFGRDIGQKLENPLPLYELTEGFSARHLAQYWDEITP
ncbi:MAG TPA: YjbH domain-containing protein [Alphaproteobacteria bacterium]|nr:YjbH domain-containing protein [Alphaproteobacteria bacterium]USO05783.1 MAG: YjbH domain-containing protein [Rhodospirillales bacterium]HOO81798.1 YjbH domain-containing protein [Alphaproteobacteria bacterium]